VRRLAALAAAIALFAPPDGPPIVPTLDEPDKPQLQLGEELFAANCVRCHGIGGHGVRAGDDPALRGPSLVDVGALSADFYLRTGYMPLADARVQPDRSRVRFQEREVQAVIAYVAALGDGPPVPEVHPETASLSEGRKLFTEHCAGCHQAVAEGGIMTGAKAPPLDRATPVQVAQAVRIGPYAMPPFSEQTITEAELDAIVAYVEYTKHPRDAGGWGINHLGPFPEGMVTWLIAIVVLIAACIVIGRARAPR
jgi:ubiquinol-cytochrome c reductase cytochrome c subunit